MVSLLLLIIQLPITVFGMHGLAEFPHVSPSHWKPQSRVSEPIHKMANDKLPLKMNPDPASAQTNGNPYFLSIEHFGPSKEFIDPEELDPHSDVLKAFYIFF